LSPRLPQKTLGIAAAALVFAAVAVVAGLSLPTNHDEFQYIAAAYLYGTLDMYRDYFYSQTPYFPIALHYWNLLLADLVGSVYVSSRLFNVGWSLLFVGTFLYVLARASPSAALCIGVFAVLFSAEALDVPLRAVRNDMMPLALTTAALALMSRRYFQARHRQARWGPSHFLAGLLLAVAVSSKHSYAPVALALALAPLTAPGLPLRDNLRQASLPLVGGGIVGALPLLSYVATDWAAMRFALVDFHRTAHVQWYLQERPDADFSMTAQFVRLAQELFNIPFLASLAVFVAFAVPVTVARPGRRDAALPHWGLLFLSILAMAFMLPLLLLARPLHHQYVAPLVPFVGLCIAAAAGILEASVAWESAKLSPRVVFAGAGLFLATAGFYYGLVRTDDGVVAHLRTMVVAAPAEGGRTTYRRNFPEVWAAEHAGGIARRLAGVLGPADGTLRIATLMTAYPIEAGYGIYPEFAGAPFFYRSNDHLSAEQRREYVGLSPSTVRGWLDTTGPQALLVGYDAGLEAGFWDYARTRGFACFRVNLSGAYNLYADGSREGFLLVSPARTEATPDCAVDMPAISARSAGDR
jgi:hypothetical protein